MADGLSPDRGAALPPTPHPLAELFGLRHDAARRRRDRPDDGRRLRLARPGRLPRLPARLALVRPPDRRRRRADRPHPRPLPLQRPARLHRPPLHRPLPRRPGPGDQAPPRRLARPRPARPRRPAPPRGLALLDRLLGLPAYWQRDERTKRRVGAGWPAWPWRGRSSGRCSTGSRPAAPPTRSPAPAKPSTSSPARPARSTSSSTARAASARCCSGRGWSARSAASSSASPSCAAAARSGSPPRPSPSPPSPCSPAPAWRSCPATRCSPPRCSPSSSPSALLGWRLLERDHPWRRAWQGFAAFIVLMFVVWGPNQYDLLHRVDVDLTNQSRIEGDLTDLADSGAFAEPLCGPIAVPNHRAVPRLAFDLDIRPTQIVSASEEAPPGAATSSTRPRRSSSTTSSSTRATQPACGSPSPPASTRSPPTSPGCSTGAADLSFP